MTYLSGLTVKPFSTTYVWSTPPQGVILHETVGHSAEGAWSTFESNHWACVAILDREGGGLAGHPLDRWGWHAREASYNFYGIEHVNIPPTQKLTVPQLETSARISAEMVAFVREHWGVDLPLVRYPGQGLSGNGFKQHRDGWDPPYGTQGAKPSYWNDNGHVDGLTSTWTWDEYLARVAEHLAPPEEDWMAEFTDSEIKRLHALAAGDQLVGFREGMLKASTEDPLKPPFTGVFAVAGKKAIEATKPQTPPSNDAEPIDTEGAPV